MCKKAIKMLVILANHRNAEPAKKKNLAHQLNTRSAQSRKKNAQIHQIVYITMWEKGRPLNMEVIGIFQIFMKLNV